MIGLTLVASVCLQYAYGHSVVRHFTRMLELDGIVMHDWFPESAYDTYVGCAGLCFKDKTCHGFSFSSGVCYTHNTYVLHTTSLRLHSPGMKTFSKKAQCVSPYSQMEDICVWMSTTSVNNSAARSKCQMDGGDLVTMPSIDKLQLLKSFMNQNGFGGRRSVGAYLNMADRTWNWLDGSRLDNPSNQWCRFYHTFKPEDACLQFNSAKCFLDGACTATFNYICEILP